MRGIIDARAARTTRAAALETPLLDGRYLARERDLSRHRRDDHPLLAQNVGGFFEANLSHPNLRSCACCNDLAGLLPRTGRNLSAR